MARGLRSNAMNSDLINILFITDENYVMPTSVSITSLILNKLPSTKYNITVLANQISEDSIKKLSQLKSQNVEINIKQVDIEQYININILQTSHVTKTALLKFFIPYIMSDEDKVLYLDSDTIINCDLTELYSTQLGTNYVAAAFDYALVKMPSLEKSLQIPKDKYFNSGVMLLNLKQLRQDKVPEKLIEYKKNGNNYFMDQNALNKVFYPNAVMISWEYNYYNVTKENRLNDSQYYYKNMPNSLTKAIKNAKIVHFADRKKPWIYQRGYLTRFYLYYYKKSPFASNKLILQKTTYKECLEKMLKFCLLQNSF